MLWGFLEGLGSPEIRSKVWAVFVLNVLKKMNKVIIHKLSGGGDPRGHSFNVPKEALRKIGATDNMHIATIKPGHIRGNHFHAEGTEVIAVLYESPWELGWDDGPDTGISTETFEGDGCVVVEIPPGCSHAVKNTGSAPLVIMAVMDKPYNPENPDMHKREVL